VIASRTQVTKKENNRKGGLGNFAPVLFKRGYSGEKKGKVGSDR